MPRACPLRGQACLALLAPTGRPQTQCAQAGACAAFKHEAESEMEAKRWRALRLLVLRCSARHDGTKKTRYTWRSTTDAWRPRHPAGVGVS